MEIDAAIWGLLGTAVGALASIGTTWISARNAKSIETEMARAQRIESAREYQRKTAIELQEALYNHARNSALVLLEKRRRERAKADGIEREEQSDSKQEEMRQSGLAISILRERISNEAIRDLVSRFQNRCAEFSAGDENEDYRDIKVEFNLDFNSVARELGVFHRSLFEVIPDAYNRVK